MIGAGGGKILTFYVSWNELRLASGALLIDYPATEPSRDYRLRRGGFIIRVEEAGN